jgi:uncharacterized protein YgfB (UPF0149 family)
MAMDSRGVSSPFDYEELANLLLEQGQAVSPADLHGCITGLLAAGASEQSEAGLAALNRTLDLDLHGDLAEQAMAMYLATGKSLRDEDLEFQPLLMDDSADLVSRTAALAGWCRSFVTGYTDVAAAAGARQASLPGDSSEILGDIAAIAEADLEDLVEDEESETAYAELTEYIRFAALNAYADRVIERGDAPGDGEGGPLLH